jgi:2-methylcitrate dehydratase PrpD
MSETHTTNLTDDVTRYALSTSYEQLPADVVDYAKRVIVDSLGCLVLGSTMPAGQTVTSYVRSQEAGPRATVVGGGFRSSAGLAALANGTAGHADELDGVHFTRGHIAVVAVPAALAVAESEQLNGKEFLNGVVLAFDIGCKMMEAVGGREAIMNTHHAHSSAVYGTGAAVAAGRMLGLEPLALNHAIALAAHNVSAPLAFMDERNHMSKAMTHGQAANAGITGAYLAKHGVEANDRILEATHGLMDFWRTDSGDESRMLAGLGEHFSVVDNGFKHYSCGYPIQGPLGGAILLMQENGISVGDIAHVKAGMSTWNADIVDDREMPSICVQDMMALGMVLGQLGFDDAHDPHGMERADVKELRSKIEIYRDPELDALPAPIEDAWVQIDTKDGRSFKTPHILPRGNWALGGAPWVDVREKFTGLVDSRLTSKPAERIIAIIEDIENVDDLGELGTLLAG